MSHHSLQLISAQYAHDSCGHCYCSVLGISASGKSIGHGRIHNVYLGHGQAGVLGQILNQSVEVRRLIHCDLTSMVHLQDQFIAVPVSPEVHCKRDDQGQKHAASSTHKAAYQEQQSGQTGQQKGRSDHVCHIDHFLFIDYLFYASCVESRNS